MMQSIQEYFLAWLDLSVCMEFPGFVVLGPDSDRHLSTSLILLTSMRLKHIWSIKDALKCFAELDP